MNNAQAQNFKSLTELASEMLNDPNLVQAVTACEKAYPSDTVNLVVEMYRQMDLRCDQVVSHRRSLGDASVAVWSTSRFEGVARQKGRKYFFARSKGSAGYGGNQRIGGVTGTELQSAARYLDWVRHNRGWKPAPPKPKLQVVGGTEHKAKEPVKTQVDINQAYKPMFSNPPSVRVPATTVEVLLSQPPQAPANDGRDREELLEGMLDRVARLSVLLERREALRSCIGDLQLSLDIANQEIELAQRSLVNYSGVKGRKA